MQPTSNNTLIAQLKNEENTSFEKLYTCYYPAIETHIIQNFGSTQDAEDIFQETILVLIQKIRQDNFVLTSSLKTYLFAIARNLWLKRLRDHKSMPVAHFESYLQESETYSFELHPETTKEEKVAWWLTKITENCQRILKAIFFYKEPMGSLMQKMGWKNKHTAANQQYKCLQQIIRQKDKEQGV